MATPTPRPWRTRVRAVLRGLLVGVGLLLGANAAWLAITANLTLGTAAAATLALGFVAWATLLPRFRHPVLVSALASAVCAGLIGCSIFLSAYGSRDDATDDEDAVIVLGAAVHGSEPSNTLLGRLDAAFAYHLRNPRALIVVSGGQGPQEALPEALAMQRYLVGRGVPSDQILQDDRSTSTEENFAFSKALLDTRLHRPYTVVFVTNDFHVYRAGRIAAVEGLPAHHVHSSTPWYFWPTDYSREVLMVLRLWLLPG